MVDRLYSRRSTKDYSFVNETVEADDIMNMTNRNDSDDSENEAEEHKDVKELQNSLLKADDNVKVNVESERIRGFKTKRESTASIEHKYPVKNRNAPEITEVTPLPSVSIRPKTSVTFQRAKSVTESKKNSVENLSVIDKSNEHLFTKPEMKRSYSSPGHRSQTSPTYRSQPTLSPRAHPPQISSFLSRSDVHKPEQTEDKSKSFLAQAVAPKSHGAELTRPTSSNFFSLFETHEEVKATKDESRAGKIDKTIEENDDPSPKSSSASKKHDSPRQKGGKPPRFAVAPCDELLIDRVATYNRTPKLRCK